MMNIFLCRPTLLQFYLATSNKKDAKPVIADHSQTETKLQSLLCQRSMNCEQYAKKYCNLIGYWRVQIPTTTSTTATMFVCLVFPQLILPLRHTASGPPAEVTPSRDVVFCVSRRLLSIGSVIKSTSLLLALLG